MGKLQHVTTYQLYHSRVEDDFSVLVISDLHFSYQVSDSKLLSIYQMVKRVEPHYILIVGDLIDSSNMVEEKRERVRLISFLMKLSDIGKILISLGNHDFYKRGKYLDDCGRKSNVCFYFDQEFFDALAHLPHVFLLDNQSYQDERIFVSGISLPFSYYRSDKGRHFEDKEILLQTLKKEHRLLFHLPHDKVKILMIHSPVYLKEAEVEKEFLEFDYVVSGHMHNGCVFLGLHEFWNTSYGIISPSKTLFPKYVRNTLQRREDKLIVNGALVTFQANTGVIQLFNFLYPLSSTLLKFTSDKKYDKEEVSKSTRYYH